MDVACSAVTGSLRDSESDIANRLLIDSNSLERPAMKYVLTPKTNSVKILIDHLKTCLCDLPPAPKCTDCLDSRRLLC